MGLGFLIRIGVGEPWGALSLPMSGFHVIDVLAISVSEATLEKGVKAYSKDMQTKQSVANRIEQ